MTETTEIDTRAWGVIRVAGQDAEKYLQGQISQDLGALDGATPAWSLLLDPGGKLVSWFRIRRAGDDEFMLDMEPAAVEATVARLQRFKLRTDAEISVEEGWTLTTYLGENPPAVSATGPVLPANAGWPGFAVHGVLFCGDGETVPQTSDIIDEARIRAAMPRLGVDIDDDTIPGEGGQRLIDLSVSFTKGCYTGQELVARIDSRGGNVPRPLRVIEADEPLTVGAVVAFEGQEIGTLTSAAANIGLGRILRKAEIGAAVTVGGVAARVIAPTD